MSIEEIKSIVAANKDTRPHFERIKQLIQQVGGTNLVDQVGGRYDRTLLWNASQFGDLKLVQFLIQHGANVDLAESTRIAGWTPLHIAARKNHLDVVKYLIQVGGAKVGAVDKHKRTSLWWASRHGFIDMVKYLIEEAGDTCINQVDTDNRTPLWFASYYGKLEVVKYLLEMGANHLMAGDPRTGSKTPMAAAQESGYTTIVNLLNEYNQEKMKAGEEKRKKIQAKAKEAAQKKQPKAIHEPSFDSQKIQSKDELGLVIGYLEKKLKSLVQEIGRDSNCEQFHQWLAANKEKRDAFVHIIKRKDDEEGILIKSLEEMMIDIAQLEANLDGHAQGFSTGCSLKILSLDPNDVDELKESHSDYYSHSMRIKEELNVLYSTLIEARLARKQRDLAMGQCF